MTNFGEVETEDDIKLIAGGYIPYVISHTALQAAAASGNATVFTAVAGEEIIATFVKPTVAFVGAGITAYTIELGISGATDQYKKAFDVTQTADQGYKPRINDIPSESGTTAIIITGTATGANTDQTSAGSVTVYIKSDKFK